MKPRVIVDGYNVLKTTPQFAELERSSLQLARDALVNWLGAKSHQYDITLVFDAWEAGFGSERTVRERGLKVIFSKQGERADDVIARLAKVSKEACIVVSRDNEVRSHALAHGCQVAAPEALFAAPKRPGVRRSISRSSSGDEEDFTERRDCKKGPSHRPKKRRGPPEWRF